VSGDLLLHILKGLKGRRAQRNSGFDVPGGDKRAVESQVLMQSIS
jgi:hypothetical protein